MSDAQLATIRTFVETTSSKSASDIGPGTRLDALPIDSLDMYTLIGELEDLHGKSMPDSDFQKMVTVGDLITFFG